MNQVLRTLLPLLLLAALCCVPARPVQAQDHNTRLQKLKEHELRIQQIIEERRRRKKEEEENAAAQQDQQPTEQVQEEEKSDEPKRAVSNVVMGLRFVNEEGQSDYNIIVQTGATFVSDVYLFNVDQNPIDRVRLGIDYDKRFIEPLKVFDTTLRPFAEGKPKFYVEDRDAIIVYDAKLKEVLASPEVVLLRILWRAKRPAPFTGIDFAFSQLEKDDDIHTAIYAEGRNILGVSDDPSDGVLSGGLMIEDPNKDDEVLQGKASELRKMYLGSVASDAQVGLTIAGPATAPRVGDEFVVKVGLNNPDGALVDSINFAVLFDPHVLQVEDWDKFNYIIRGVNVQDGLYHYYFPWDMHKKNEVRNDRGLAEYEMALSNGSALPTRTFASIRFRCIAPISETEIGFVKGRPGAPDMTSVRYFGYERLNLTNELSHPTIRFPILPAPIDVAKKSDKDEVTSKAVDAQDLSVHSLKIER